MISIQDKLHSIEFKEKRYYLIVQWNYQFHLNNDENNKQCHCGLKCKCYNHIMMGFLKSLYMIVDK